MPRAIQSIERAAAILRLLSGHARGLGVAELSTGLELPKGTVHGLLRTLQLVGFVQQDPESGKYRLGAALLELGSSYLGGSELRTRALSWADALAARSAHGVRVGALHEGQVLIIHHVFGPGDRRQSLEVGTLLPVHATALGKALLAGQPQLASDPPEEDLSAYTAATITDLRRLQRELDDVRERGWASDVEELVDGVAAIAAPIQDRRRLTVGAMGISGPVEELCVDGRPDEKLVTYVRDAARAVSRELGAIPW